MMEHTPTPWKARPNGDTQWWVCGPGGQFHVVCITSQELDRENAEFIERAANSHEALVEACRELERWASAHVHDRNINKGTWLDRLLAKTSAALATAAECRQKGTP